jgi:endoglycosylceramidase
MLLEGPLDDLEARRTSAQVTAAFASFFDPADAAGLQAAYLDMIAYVAARYAENPAVIGFEIFNEPVIEASKLDPFHVRAAEALRAAAPKKLIFFEPPAVRNFLDFQPLASEPFPVDGAVYAPHIYTFVFRDEQNRLATLTKEDLRSSVDNARAEAQAWGTPLFVGEFGIGPEMTNADRWMRFQAELQDEYLASNAFWVWKEESQGRWGLFDYSDADGTWTERMQVRDWVSRVYPQRIAGTVESLTFDGTTGTMTLVAHSSSSLPHVIYVPASISEQLQVRCNGEGPPVSRDAWTGTIEVVCSGTLHVGTTIPF